MNCALILSFFDQTNLKIILKFSVSQYRCHKTPIDVENCIKSALNSNHRKQNFTVIEKRACRKTDLGGGDYYLRNSGLPSSIPQEMGSVLENDFWTPSLSPILSILYIYFLLFKVRLG